MQEASALTVFMDFGLILCDSYEIPLLDHFPISSRASAHFSSFLASISSFASFPVIFVQDFVSRCSHPPLSPSGSQTSIWSLQLQQQNPCLKRSSLWSLWTLRVLAANRPLPGSRVLPLGWSAKGQHRHHQGWHRAHSTLERWLQLLQVLCP